MPVETDAAGPVDVAVVLVPVPVLPVLVVEVVEAPAVTSFAPQTPFCTAAPTLDLR